MTIKNCGRALVFLFTFTSGLSSVLASPAPPPFRTLSEVVGVTHAYPIYNVSGSTLDTLNEGAARIKGMGSKAIKVWVDGGPGCAYPNFSHSAASQWPASPSGGYSEPLQVVQTPFFKKLLSDPDLKIYVLEVGQFANNTVNPPIPSISQPLRSLSDAQSRETYRQIYNLATYLLQTYKGTGKFFIIENWEADNMIDLASTTDTSAWYGPPGTPSAPNAPGLTGPAGTGAVGAIPAMQTWMAQRQAATKAARVWAINHGYFTGVCVANGFEINKLPRWAGETVNYKNKAGQNYPLLIDAVVPNFQCDLYGYSAWEVIYPDGGAPAIEANREAATLYPRMRYMKSKVPTGGFLGSDNIYVGEYGTYEFMWFPGSNKNHHDANSDTNYTNTIAQEIDYLLCANPRYVFMWQLYGNELRSPNDPYTPYLPRKVTLNDVFYSGFSASEEYCTGTWLIRPPGLPGGVTDNNGTFYPTPSGSSAVTATGAYSILDNRMHRYLYTEDFDNANHVEVGPKVGITTLSSAPWGDYTHMTCGNNSIIDSFTVYCDRNPASPNPAERIADIRLHAFLKIPHGINQAITFQDKIRYRTSPDKVTWSDPYLFWEPFMNFIDSTTAGANWYETFLHSTTVIPAGHKYLKIEFMPNPNQNWQVYIGTEQIYTQIN